MPVPPRPEETYARAAEEGAHRLDSTTLQLLSRSFIAGFNIVFGIIAFGVVYARASESFGAGAGQLLGGIAFGIGFVLLVVGRSELFTENFLDPVAAALERGGRAWLLLGRLWVGTLAVNLVGGTAFVLLITTEGAMPRGAPDALARVAEEITATGSLGGFMNAVAAGGIITLMTWLLHAVDGTGSQIVIAWITGAFVALGPFNHVVVTGLHLLFGWRYGAAVSWGEILSVSALAAAGNLLGGLVFVTLTHIGQVKASPG